MKNRILCAPSNRQPSIVTPKWILFLFLLPLVSCGQHQISRELERNHYFAEILNREGRRSLGEDKFFKDAVLANPDPLIRQWSALALGRIACPRSLTILYGALHHGDASVRAASAFAIGEIEDRDFLQEQSLTIDPDAVPELLRCLNDPSITVQMRAVEALGKTGSHAAAAEIIEHVQRFTYSGQPDEQAYLEYAITALVRLRDPVAAPVLESLSNSSDPKIKWRALDALTRLRIRTAGLFFIKNLGNPDPEVQAYAAKGMGVIADPKLAGRLSPLLSPRHPQTEMPNPLPVRIAALQALGEMKNPSAIPAIKKALEAEPIDAAHPDQLNFAIKAASAVGAIGAEEGIPVLMPLLRSRQPIANKAVIAMAKILKTDPQQFFRLANIDSFLDPEGQRAWAQALAELGGEDADRELKRMLVRTLKQNTVEEKDALPAILKAVGKSKIPGWRDILVPFFNSHDADLLLAAVAAYRPKADAKAPWTPIIRAYKACAAGNNTETKIRILAYLKPWVHEMQVQEVLRLNLHDSNRDVRMACAALLRYAGATDIIDDPGPAKDTLSESFRYSLAAIRKRSTIAVLETTRGIIEIELFRQDAPVTCASFVMAADQGIYNGTEFVQVSPGNRIEAKMRNTRRAFHRTIKSEVQMRPFERGSLGMELSGRNSDISRIFITLSPQPYLDGTNTCFGRVISGIQAAERIVPGDQIKKISIKETVSSLNYNKY